MVRFVLKRGPFRLKTWSVLSLAWSVLSCRGPFCPWSVLSMVRYVPNSFLERKQVSYKSYFCYKYFGYQKIVISKLYFTDIQLEIYSNHGN